MTARHSEATEHDPGKPFCEGGAGTCEVCVGSCGVEEYEGRLATLDVNALWDLLPIPEAQAIRNEAQRILDLTTAAEGGRQFVDRAGFEECLRFLAVLSCDQAWAWLL